MIGYEIGLLQRSLFQLDVNSFLKMPKVSTSSLPLSGIFAVDKPTGAVTMPLLNSLNTLLASTDLFLPKEDHNKNNKKQKRRGRNWPKKVKLGQGGTLDPLASGVLVIGLNDGTKRLHDYLHGTKEYRAIGLLGSATDSYDAQGRKIREAPWQHITKEKVESVLNRFRGEIKQIPPIYSALKMDGMPLYEYARQNKPLPRPIETRTCTVHKLELLDWKEGNSHSFRAPDNEITAQDSEMVAKLEKMVQGNTDTEINVDPEKAVLKDLVTDQEKPKLDSDNPGILEDIDVQGSDAAAMHKQAGSEGENLPEPSPDSGIPPVFEIRMTVSGGTYVRCLVHDIGLALGSAAHVVVLERTRQGQFALDPANITKIEGEDTADEVFGVVPWSVFDEGIKSLETRKAGQHDAEKVAEDEDLPWVRAVLDNLQQ